LTHLETEITYTICDNNFIKQIISDQSYSTSIKINLFERFKKFNENSCCMLIQQCEFSSNESSDLGDIILDRKWKNAAEVSKYLDKNQGRSDLHIAVKRTTSLLKVPLIKRLYKRRDRESGAQINLKENRFEIALSFPGEKRTYVENVVKNLLKTLYKEEVFYDNHFKSQISQPNADTILQNVYRHNSKLIVVFLCSEYAEKDWCGLECRAIRDIIKTQNSQKVMLIKFDQEEIEGFFSIDGHIDANTHTEDQVSKLILERLEANIKG
ncbi:MAG: hypothetical protein ACJAS1_007320, partial [Oleiphilaceae bacterium]